MPAYRTRDNSRSLEVTTDVPNPPTLTIISPTPRAFSFPNNSHSSRPTLQESPVSSPSSSPFEPDLRPLALTCTPPPPPLSHLISTIAASPSSSLFPPHHTIPSHHLLQKRRNSTPCALEHRPKKGDEDYIKRPENAFILFRRKCCEDRQQAHEEAALSPEGPAKKQRQADLSKTISQQWKSLSPEKRQYWEDLAKEKKKEHEQMYPNYVYRPQRSKGKDDKSKAKKIPPKQGSCISRRNSEVETDSDSVSFVLPIPNHNRHGRSASAPTPPLYQQITVPNVYMPSCPTSPNLLPMIARRSSHPSHHPVISHFDYLPTAEGISPASSSSSYSAHFEQNLHSSSLYQNMFDISGQPIMGGAPTLPTLDLSGVSEHHHAMLLASNQHQHLISPASSDSGSPCSAPFTPTYAFPYPGPHDLSPTAESVLADTCAELDLAGTGAAADLAEGSLGWDPAGLWSDDAGGMLHPEDLDINLIPPIAMNDSSSIKYDLSEQHQQQMRMLHDDGVGYVSHHHSHLEQQMQQPHVQHLHQMHHVSHDSMDGFFGYSELMVGHAGL